MRISKLFTASVTCAAMLAVGLAAPAIAAPTQDSLDRLVELNPGSTEALLTESIADYSATSGQSFDAVLAQALREAEVSAAAAAAPAVTVTGPGKVGVLSSPGGGSYSLGLANNRGDVFVTPAYTGPINHGHAGIFFTTGTLIEAPGLGKKSRSITVADYKVAKTSVKQSVKVTTTKRNAAGAYAQTNLRGKDYNPNFAINRDANGDDMNCSQLVWAAYKKAGGIDIDGNGGTGVYPYDIKDSTYTTTYKTF
ncbi:hypothetical protein EYE40_13990 [Glaciihabitans arcticus]|uniref:Uncharacterized protein n=1 Tax=Glaciihabitans arcticus TaxID=2668039 RepID=A0A4Q9GVW7_9MICO|nr:hypothetical protein [Glaciihabitans arcticus]TBN58414.1 hypothetical protein EYE40_13990 [Glaciihabitans arcticus]